MEGHPTSKSEKGPYKLSNHGKGNLEITEPRDQVSKNLSEDSKSLLDRFSNNQQYINIPSNQEKGLSEANFITLGRIPKEQKIEIIKTGFQRQAEGKISLKKYYEGVSEANSLFQLKGYSIKRTKLYQQLKE